MELIIRFSHLSTTSLSRLSSCSFSLSSGIHFPAMLSFFHWEWLMSARRTWSGTTENGSEITFTGCVDLKVWKKLPQGRSLKSNIPLPSAREPGILSSDTVSAKNKLIWQILHETISPECEISAEQMYFVVLRGTVHTDMYSRLQQRNSRTPLLIHKH